MAVIKIVPMPGPSGNGGGVSSTVPFELNDTNDDLLLSITKTGTGTTRIDAPQDDLSLRSARDITLYPGTDGAGNVYIGWGDATITPDATNRVATIGDIQAASIADFVFTNEDSNNSSMTITGDKEMTIESGADNDLNLRAGDDVWITSGDDVILQADDQVQIRSSDNIEIMTNFVDMGNAEKTWEFTTGGRLNLPGDGYIENIVEGSSDGLNNDTLKLVPDSSLGTDQYLIIEPTSGNPTHIHIRSGGLINESDTDLIVGGEKNNVIVSDTERGVTVSTRPASVSNSYENLNETTNAQFITNMPVSIEVGDTVPSGGTIYVVSAVSLDTPGPGLVTVTATGLNEFYPGETYTFTHEEPWNNAWQFTDTGYLYGPAMGGLFVSGLLNGENDLWLGSSNNVVLSPGSGEAFIDDPSIPSNQIAKIAYSRENYTTPATINAVVSHMGKLLYANCNDTGDMTYLIPDNVNTFPIGSEIKFATNGTARWFINRADVEGSTTLIAESTSYYGINDSYPYIIPINSTGTLLKVDTDRWILSGPRITD